MQNEANTRINFVEPERLKKQELALKYTLQGREWFDALRAMEFAKEYHCGMRKDEVTPEFAHQIGIALFIMNMPFPKHCNVEHMVMACLLHDVMEDYEVTRQKIVELFGEPVAESVCCLSKELEGSKKGLEAYLTGLSKNIVAAICKGADRINNFQSMPNVFSLAKQKEYILEGLEILKMLKKARRNFPEYANTFFNIEFILRSQVELIQCLHHVIDHGYEDKPIKLKIK